MTRSCHGLLGLALTLSAASATAEMHFLAKQYARCAACHYSESGGSLLTPYGRFLSREELSTTGKTSGDGDSEPTEQQSLYGLVGKWTEEAGVDVGVTMRPSRLEFGVGDIEFSRTFWMRADVQAAWRKDGWTAYAEVGRLPTEPAEVITREHWVQHQSESGLGVKLGRFLPAFGLRTSDHTNFNRRDIGFDQDDQLYGIELSDRGDGHLVQFAFGARAESLLEDDGQRAFTAMGRLQMDFSSRSVLVLSGLMRANSRNSDAHAVSSVAFGFAPTRRLSLWTELDSFVAPGWKGTPRYSVFHEAAFEVTRGLWLKFSPQLLTELGNISGGTRRLALGVQFLPRTHYNLNLTWTHDRDRVGGTTFTTTVLQAHIYL